MIRPIDMKRLRRILRRFVRNRKASKNSRAPRTPRSLSKTSNTARHALRVRSTQPKQEPREVVFEGKIDFEETIHKVKGLYDTRHDNTSLDRFIIQLRALLSGSCWAIGVMGVRGERNNLSLKTRDYSFDSTPVSWTGKKISNGAQRKYLIRIYLDSKKINFKVCNKSWAEYIGFPAGNKHDYDYNKQLCDLLLGKFLKNSTNSYSLSAFCGACNRDRLHQSRITLLVTLPITGYDAFLHCGVPNLTNWAKSFRNEIAAEVARITEREMGSYGAEAFFRSNPFRRKVIREAENIVRARHGITKVGDGLISETLLAQHIHKHFPDAIREYRARWLGKFRLDIYVPSVKLAIEYQGRQHYEPVSIFGGQEKFIMQQKRDERLRGLCRRQGVTLLEWSFQEEVTPEAVFKFLVEGTKDSKFAAKIRRMASKL